MHPDEKTQPLPGTIRYTHRLREISLQAMSEGSAASRMNRTIRARTTVAADTLNFSPGGNSTFILPLKPRMRPVGLAQPSWSTPLMLRRHDEQLPLRSVAHVGARWAGTDWRKRSRASPPPAFSSLLSVAQDYAYSLSYQGGVVAV